MFMINVLRGEVFSTIGKFGKWFVLIYCVVCLFDRCIDHACTRCFFYILSVSIRYYMRHIDGIYTVYIRYKHDIYLYE